MRDDARTAVEVLSLVFGERLQTFSVRLWDGSDLRVGGAPFTLVINDPGALRAAFRPPLDLNAGRAFAAGLIDVEGDAEAAVDTLLTARPPTALRALKLARLLRRLPTAELPRLREARLHGKRHSIARDRAAIGFHYDLPVEFYQSFLDPEMVYSCAYFDDGVDTLADAQLAKIDYTLSKLRVRPGEKLLDVGCGWGALVLRAAERFGAIATGVTLSTKQYEEAQRRIAQRGLEDRVTVELRDYRELASGSFDKIASVGMFEHVGREQMSAYFEKAYALLRPGGLFLNHAIAQQTEGDGKAGGFMHAFIFPDGELVRISEALRFAEQAGFEVRDVENLREHYRRTLRAWVRNLQANAARAKELAGDQTYRAWRLYLSGSAQGFHRGRIGLYQSLLAKRDAHGIAAVPATRRDLYTPRNGRAS